MNKQIFFLESQYTIPRLDYESFSQFEGEKILIYPKDEVGEIKQYFKHFNKTIGVSATLSFELVHIFNYPELSSTVQKLQVKGMNPIFISVFEFYNEAVAQLRTDFNSSGINATAMKKYRDKGLMHTLLSQNPKIKLPLTEIFDQNKYRADKQVYFNETSNNLGLPIIIKSIEGTSSIDVFLVETYVQFSELKLNGTQNFIMQQFINSKLLHVDFVIYKQKMVFFDVCETSIPQMEIKNMPKPILAGLPIEDNILKDQIKDFTKQVIKSLNCEDSCYHLEVFLNKNNELIFLEIAARPGGGGISKMYKTMYGVSLFYLYLGVLCDTLKVIDYSTKKLNHALWMDCSKDFDIKSLKLEGTCDKFSSNIAHSFVISDKSNDMIVRDFTKIVTYSYAAIKDRLG